VSAGRLFLEALRFDFESLDQLRRRVDAALAHDVGGFIFFGADAESAGRLAGEIHAAAGRPLWMAADLERGAGQHLRGLTTFPPPLALTHHPEPEYAARVAGRSTALEARHLGLNLALAPVLDLDVEAENPIVGTRSFGFDPELVARLGAAWIQACQSQGVAACAKHFPGHGRTTADSHAELPVVAATREQLEADLEPFRSVAESVACVMSAHVAYPALGAEGPATLESKVLEDLLRDELGFRGLVLTDALNMSGVREGAEVGSPGVRALMAGCDILLYPPDLGRAIAAVDEAAGSDDRVRERVALAVERSERLLSVYGSHARHAEKPRADLADLAAAVSSASVKAFGGGLPSWLHPSQPVRVATVWDDREDPARPPFGIAFRETLRAAGWNVLPPGPAEPGAALLVLVASTPQAWKGTAGFTPTAGAALEGILAGERTYPVLFGHPRLLTSLGGIGLCAWATEPAMEAAAAHRLDALARGTAR
jgi:beta-glucosidase